MESRIVGGTEVTPINKYPWIVDVMSETPEGYIYSCAGSLVASNYVITAAHCVFNHETNQWRSPNQLLLTLGDHYLDIQFPVSEPLETRVRVSEIKGHAGYDPSSMNNDIAVLKLVSPLDLSVYTPVCLAESSEDNSFDGNTAQVYGWGSTSEGSSMSPVLMVVSVPVVSNDVCSYAMNEYITNGKICAGGELNKDACQVRI